MAVPESRMPATTATVIELQSPSTRAPTSQFSLPRCLARPLFRPIPPETISAIDPLLTDIPLAYILNELRNGIGPRLLGGVQATQAVLPSGPLPNELLVQFNDEDLELPTHILAVHSRQQPNPVTLYPCHAIVVSTGCAHLTILPDPEAGEPEPPYILPIVYVALPSPEMFQPILTYLYTRQNNIITDELLPVEFSPTEPIIEWAKKQAQKYTTEELLANARKIWGVWANACALGIFDDHLFSTIDFVWEVCVTALDIAVRASRGPGGNARPPPPPLLPRPPPEEQVQSPNR